MKFKNLFKKSTPRKFVIAYTDFIVLHNRVSSAFNEQSSTTMIHYYNGISNGEIKWNGLVRFAENFSSKKEAIKEIAFLKTKQSDSYFIIEIY